jgi:carboxymethylenebutenolidase
MERSKSLSAVKLVEGRKGNAYGSKFMDLHEEYTHGSLDRREFMKRLVTLAGGTAAAGFILPLSENSHAQAAGVAAGDSRLNAEHITYPGATGEVRAYFARPKGNVKLPGVVVIHENRGLNPHIEDVTLRIALEGFQAVAPDALSPMGGTPEDFEKAIKMIGQLDGQSTMKNFTAAVQYLKTYSLSTGKIGVVGFCWGGAMANQVAVNSPDLIAAVPYYGRQPAIGDVQKIKASLLLHYAGIDESINKGIPPYEEALKKASVDYKLYMYDGAKHAFNNDTNAERYNKEAAGVAWKRTIDFLNKKLKT